MTLDGEYTATIDRIVSGIAVVLVEDDGETVDEVHIDPEDLPDGSDGEGAVLHLTFEDGELVEIEGAPDETEARLEKARDRFERLSERPPKKD